MYLPVDLWCLCNQFFKHIFYLYSKMEISINVDEWDHCQTLKRLKVEMSEGTTWGNDYEIRWSISGDDVVMTLNDNLTGGFFTLCLC